MNPNDMVDPVVQKQATVGDIITDHITGLGGYQIAQKYGIDPEKVKKIVAQANEEGRFIPAGVEPEPEASDLAVENAKVAAASKDVEPVADKIKQTTAKVNA